MTDRVLGVDICRGRVVACLLTELPIEPHETYQDYEFFEFPLTRDGVQALLDLEPTTVVYEPTGVAYSRAWVARIEESGIETMAVDHAKLRAYRKGLGLPDKDDEADSLALACYRLDPMKQGRAAFLRKKPPIVLEVRRLSLRLQHLDRRKSPIINRLKQDLETCFPEQATKDCDKAPLFWGWLAGERKSAKYDRLLEQTIGLGLYPEIRTEAQALTQCLREETEIERRLELLIKTHDEFRPYLRVLSRWGFGLRQQAILMTQIFPLEDFLKDGKVEVRQRRSRKTGKKITQHRSLRRFQKAIGVAPTREDSGDVQKRRRSGSSLCRKTLWQWQFTRIENLSIKTRNAIVLEFREIFREASARFSIADVSHLVDRTQLQNSTKLKGVRLKLARAYIRRKVSIRLFYDLVNELRSD
ncbi:MAG: hypothetical protein MUF72_10130 [Elainella sp. Prado103]|jgi:transposase|nr:hypothetical protein [Elainella sp. Prado103]